MPTSETVLQKTSLTWRLQPKPHCRGHGSTYQMVVKLLRWCTSNFLEFSRDFQESPPKVCHGMLFTGRSLGRHSTANSPEGVPWKTTGSWVLSAVMSAGIRLKYAHMHTLLELDPGGTRTVQNLERDARENQAKAPLPLPAPCRARHWSNWTLW